MNNINNLSNPKLTVDDNSKKQKLKDADYIIKSKININTIDLIDHLKENYGKDEELIETLINKGQKFTFIKFKTYIQNKKNTFLKLTQINMNSKKNTTKNMSN